MESSPERIVCEAGEIFCNAVWEGRGGLSGWMERVASWQVGEVPGSMRALRAFSGDEYQANSGMAVQGANGQGFVTGHDFIRAARPFF